MFMILRDWIDDSKLSKNKNAIELLKANLNKIDWHQLSRNPAAIELLKDNYDKINWDNLSRNPAAIELLRKNKINQLDAIIKESINI
jgi:hypothetical protein